MAVIEARDPITPGNYVRCTCADENAEAIAEEWRQQLVGMKITIEWGKP